MIYTTCLARTLGLLLVFALLVAPLQAQTRGTISGYIKDSTGSNIPDVPVTLTNERTGTKRTVASDPMGFYQVIALSSGVYTIEAQAAGFKLFRNTGVILRVDENVRA